MTARLATGRAVQPRLVKSIGGVEVPVEPAPELPFDREWFRLIDKALHETVNGRSGTAWRSRIVAEGMEMAGKTGTSQVRNITAAERARGVVSRTNSCRGSGATTRSSWPLHPSIGRSTRCRSWSSMAAEGRPPRRRSRATSCSSRSTAGLPPLDAYPADQRERDRHDAERIDSCRSGAAGTGAEPRVSYLEYTVKTVPTGVRKLLYMHWPLVLLLGAVMSVGLLMLTSVAGGNFGRWAEPQLIRFGMGLTVMFAVAMVPIWFWRNMAAWPTGSRSSFSSRWSSSASWAWARSGGSTSASCGCSRRS
jgi:hypothetical protein